MPVGGIDAPAPKNKNKIVKEGRPVFWLMGVLNPQNPRVSMALAAARVSLYRSFMMASTGEPSPSQECEPINHHHVMCSPCASDSSVHRRIAAVGRRTAA